MRETIRLRRKHIALSVRRGARRSFCFDLNSMTYDSRLFRLDNDAGKGIKRLFCPDFDHMLWDSRPFLSDNDIEKKVVPHEQKREPICFLKRKASFQQQK